MVDKQANVFTRFPPIPAGNYDRNAATTDGGGSNDETGESEMIERKSRREEERK